MQPNPSTEAGAEEVFESVFNRYDLDIHGSDNIIEEILDGLKSRGWKSPEEVAQKCKEARIEERQHGKADVMKLRDMFLATDDSPGGEREVAIRNHLRNEIANDFDDRIAELNGSGREG